MKIPQAPAVARIPDLVATLRRMDCVRLPMGGCYRFLLSCPERFDVVAAARWDDIDLDTASWQAPSRDCWRGTFFRPIPLPRQIVSMLSAMPRGSEWVFARPHAREGHISRHGILHSFALFHETRNWSASVVRQTFMAWAKLWVGTQGGHFVVRQPIDVLLHEGSTLFLNECLYPTVDSLLCVRDVVQAWADAVETVELELNDAP